MTRENTRREFLRRYGTAGGVIWGFPATAAAESGGTQLATDERVGAIGQSAVDITFGCYYVDVDGPAYEHVVLHFSDGHSESFTGAYGGTTTFSYTGYRGNGDVIPNENGIDFGAVPSTPPADETYDQFHGPITHVTVVGDRWTTFERAELPGCVTGVDLGCSQVGFDSPWEILCFEMVLLYEDGSYKRFLEYPDIEDDPFGNEFRNNQRLDRVYIQHDPEPEDWYVFTNPNTDCTPPGSSTTTFSCTEVTVETDLFPTIGHNTITLEFTDGSTQEVGEEIDEDTEFPITFSGQGAHDGKIISALQIYIGAYDGIVWYLTNPQVADCEENVRTFEVLSTDEDVEFAYEFTVDGDVWKSTADDNRADPDDQITENDDGTLTVTGTTGDRQGDVFAVVGEIIEFEKTGGASGVRLVLDGEDVTDEFLDRADESLLEIVSLEEGAFSYEVVVDGSAEKARVSAKIKSENNDEIREIDGDTVLIDGFTGNPGYGDAYRVTGEITDFEHTGGDAAVVIRLDGEDVTDEFLDRPDESLLEIVSLEEGEFSYQVVIDGSAEKARVSERIQSQDNDEIRETDGETVIDGFTGNPGYGDAYRITGEIVEFERVGGDADVVIRLDGEDVTEEFLGGDDTSLLEIVSTEEGEFSYRIVVDGSAEKIRITERIQSEDNDEIRETNGETVIDGFTGNPGYGDAYRIIGEIVEFERVGGDADVVIRLNGSEVSLDELT